MIMITETSTSYGQNASYHLKISQIHPGLNKTPFINSLSNNPPFWGGIFLGCQAIPFSVPASNFLATPLTLTNTPTVGEPG